MQSLRWGSDRKPRLLFSSSGAPPHYQPLSHCLWCSPLPLLSSPLSLTLPMERKMDSAAQPPIPLQGDEDCFSQCPPCLAFGYGWGED